MSSWIKNNAMDTDKQKNGQAFGLKVAGSSSGLRQDEGVGIMMSMDKDEATRRQERDAEAAAKRQQNALPTWHLKSTITGDLTALGIQEHARAMKPSGSVVPSSNDDTLKGLGIVGPTRVSPTAPSAVEVVKPENNDESDCTSLVVCNHGWEAHSPQITTNITLPWQHQTRHPLKLLHLRSQANSGKKRNKNQPFNIWTR